MVREHPSVMRIRSIPLLAALILVACGNAIFNHKHVIQDQAALESGLARVRGLDFTRSVPVVVEDPNQVQRAIIAQISRNHSDEDLLIGGETGVMTGLYPPGIELKRKTIELLRNEIIAFYNPDTKQMIVVQRS